MKRTLFDSCAGCVSLPCQLPSDPTCILKSYYNSTADIVSFQLTMQSIENDVWFGIVFNPAPKPGMVITIHLSKYLHYFKQILSTSILTNGLSFKRIIQFKFFN